VTVSTAEILNARILIVNDLEANVQLLESVVSRNAEICQRQHAVKPQE
jgi:hypothetical protein